MNQHVVIRTPAQQVMVEVAEKHKIGVADIRSRHRQAYLVSARVEAANRLFNETDLTVNQIARFMRRDHSTVSYYLGEKLKSKRSYNKSRKIDRSFVMRYLAQSERDVVIEYAKAEECTVEALIAQWVGERARYEAEAKARTGVAA